MLESPVEPWALTWLMPLEVDAAAEVEERDEPEAEAGVPAPMKATKMQKRLGACHVSVSAVQCV